MNSSVLLYGTLLFLVSLVLHVIIWRIRVPRHDALVLFFIFLGAPSVLFFAGHEIRNVIQATTLARIETIYALLLHFALSCAYIASYPAAQAISPSLDILLVIASSEFGRLTEKEINAYYPDTELVSARINDLKRSVLIAQGHHGLTLTFPGRVVTFFFITYRRLLGLKAGEG
ncbi:MAG: hypothetical protein EPN25_07025 [Nitrospirae bacterium]|nr:MAG: hypothetical protein EPN25_07025 [Nitrospirota bacterium]